MKHLAKTTLCLLLVVLLAAAALTGCAENTPATAPLNTEAPKTEAPGTVPPPQTDAPATTQAPETEAPETTQMPETQAPEAQRQELGEGDQLFYFDVTFSDGETASYAIHTDAQTVGEALVALELIAGDESAYGLYVKTVGGETLDWDADGMYWAFYENGEYAMTGVDSTAVTDGATYAFVATKG